MPKPFHTLNHEKPSEAPKNQVIDLLNESLADMIDLKLQAKQAHWNVKDEAFLTLHTLFDGVATQAEAFADQVAERAVQLGGIAIGTLHTIGAESRMPHYPVSARSGQQHLQAVSACIKACAEHTLQGIDASVGLNDPVTADLFTQVTAGLDKQRWFVESHLKA